MERTYIIPLRRSFLKTPKYKRAKKSVTTVKEFLMRHMKVSDPKNLFLGAKLNEELWKHGIKNPPSRIKVLVTKDDKGIVRAELEGFAYVDKKKQEKEDKPETMIDKVKKFAGAKEGSKEEKEDDSSEELEKRKEEAAAKTKEKPKAKPKKEKEK